MFHKEFANTQNPPKKRKFKHSDTKQQLETNISAVLGKQITCEDSNEGRVPICALA